MTIQDNRVAVSFTGVKGYPTSTPYHPPEKYPEIPRDEVEPENQVFAWVRETLRNLDLDKENFGTASWNPLKDIVKPGMTVFIKPSTVRHSHTEGKDVLSVIVHGSIIRAMLEYVCIAMKDEGRIIVGDSQVVVGLFDETQMAAGIDKVVEWHRAHSPIPIEHFDLRLSRSKRTWLYGKWGRKKIEHDPRGYQLVDLGNKSYFKDIDATKLRINCAPHQNMYKHHSNGRHEYLFPKSFLESDVIINLPKLKTHRRTGVTLALKNLMGLPAMKDSLPHWQNGCPEEGGDQYLHPSPRKRTCTKLDDIIQSNPHIPVKFVCAVVKKILWNSHRIIPFKDDYYEAMWYGNDTLWRTLLDLNRTAFYADKNGVIQDTPQRGHFCLLDGILAGERDGPVSVDVVQAGVLIAGLNPVAVDCVGTSLMGFDIDKVPLVSKGIDDCEHTFPVFFGKREDIQVIDGPDVLSLSQFAERRNLRFEPHPNWKNHIEHD
ncbi:DUF362 domain-containing protein [Candidatus Hydrogenedentota bacterium]